MGNFLRNINNYVLLLLVFSVTFENWDPIKLGGTLSITRITSIIYILTWIPLLKTHVNIKPLKKYMIPLLLYVVVGVISTTLNSGYAESLKDVYNRRVIQLIVLTFLIANHIYHQPSIIYKLLNTYLASILVMFVLFIMGIGTSIETGRILIFGENPNLLGMKAAIGFMIVISSIIDQKFTLRSGVIGFLLSVPMIMLVVASASRGALLSIFLGMAILVYYMKINILKKALMVLAGIGFGAFMFSYIISTNPVFAERLTRTIETGETGRNWLWEAALNIIQDNLLFGVGIPGGLPEMFKYSGRFIDPHNVFLWVFMTTGLFGFIFFTTFIVRIGKNLYASFKDNGKILFLVIFVIVLFNMSKAGGGIGKIIFWFYFAVLIGSTFLVSKNPLNKTENIAL